METSRKTRKSSEFARNECRKESSFTNANWGKSKVNNFSLAKDKDLHKTDKPLFRDASVQASENDARIPKNENGKSHLNVYSGCKDDDRCIYCKKPLTSADDNVKNSRNEYCSSRLEFGSDCNERGGRCIYCKKPLMPADIEYDLADDNSRDAMESFRRSSRIYFLSRGSDENCNYVSSNSPSRLLKYSHPYETSSYKMVPLVRHQSFGTRRPFTSFLKDGRPGAVSSNRDLIRTLDSTDIHPRYFDGGHFYNSRPIPSYNIYESMVYSHPYNCNECNEPSRQGKFFERQYSKRPPSFQNQYKTFQNPKLYAQYLEDSDWITPHKIRHMDSSNDFHRDVYGRSYSDNNFVSSANPKGSSCRIGNCGDPRSNCHIPFKQMYEPLSPLASDTSNIVSRVPKWNEEQAQSESQAYPSTGTNSRNYFSSPGKSIPKEPQAPFPYTNMRYSLLRRNCASSEAEKNNSRSQKESPMPAMSQTLGNSNGSKHAAGGNDEQNETLNKANDGNRIFGKTRAVYSSAPKDSPKFDKVVRSKNQDSLSSTIYSSTSNKERSIPDKLESPLVDTNEQHGKAHPSSAKKINSKNWVKNTSTPAKKDSSSLVPTYESASRKDEVPNRYSHKQEPEKATVEEPKKTLNKCSKSDSVENYDEADREVAEILASRAILCNAATTAPLVRQSKNTNAARKNKSYPIRLTHDFRDVFSDTEAYLKPLPSTVAAKGKKTNANQQKIGTSDATNHTNIQSSLQEIMSVPVKNQNNMPMQPATNGNRSKKFYKKPEVKDQVYQNADDVLKEMKLVLIEKGKWQGK